MSEEVPEVCQNCERGRHKNCDGKLQDGVCSCVVCK